MALTLTHTRTQPFTALLDFVITTQFLHYVWLCTELAYSAFNSIEDK